MELLISGMAGLSIILISIGLYLMYEEKVCEGSKRLTCEELIVWHGIIRN